MYGCRLGHEQRSGDERWGVCSVSFSLCWLDVRLFVRRDVLLARGSGRQAKTAESKNYHFFCLVLKMDSFIASCSSSGFSSRRPTDLSLLMYGFWCTGSIHGPIR